MTGVHRSRVFCAGLAALLAVGGAAPAAGQAPLSEKFPEAREIIALIEGFPLLKNLLELDNPWRLDALALKKHVFTGPMELAFGTREKPLLFVERRRAHAWRDLAWEDAQVQNPADRPGQKVWDQRAYLTDYYVADSARPLIRLHIGRPLLERVDRMKVLYPEVPFSAREQITANIERIVEALAPYGAKKLPVEHAGFRRYLLPGGTLLALNDYSSEKWSSGEEGWPDRVRIKIDFEPAEPPAGREVLPFLVPWRPDDRGREDDRSPAAVLEFLAPSQPVHARTSAAAREAPPKGEWPDVADGFASVDAMGQNGTTGGAGGKTVTVTNQVELERYAMAVEPYIIRVKGAIHVTPKPNPVTRYERLTPREIHVASDKTVIGVGKTGEIVNGGFFLGPGTHNVIIRNLTIRDTYVNGDWWGMSQDDDGLQMDTAHHVWIDHCHFSRHGDGMIDSRLATTYVTVSWCIFSKHNKTFGTGWHDDITAQLTMHHNWFRNTSCRCPLLRLILRAHLYNNYLQNVGSRGHWSRDGTNLVLQNSVFENVNHPHQFADCHRGQCKNLATLVASGNIYRNTRGRRDTYGRAFFDPSRFYPYTLDEAEAVPGILAQYAGPQETIGQ
jgi:pectate lyase